MPKIQDQCKSCNPPHPLCIGISQASREKGAKESKKVEEIKATEVTPPLIYNNDINWQQLLSITIQQPAFSPAPNMSTQKCQHKNANINKSLQHGGLAMVSHQLKNQSTSGRDMQPFQLHGHYHSSDPSSEGGLKLGCSFQHLHLSLV